MMPDSQYWIEALDLTKHPEGGYFKECYRCPEKITIPVIGERNLATSIYFLLPSNDVSRFHRLKSDESWYYHAGSSLALYIIDKEGNLSQIILGPDMAQGEFPQIIVPRGSIFGAAVCQANSFTLMGCVVTPGFDYRDFELISRKMLLEQYPQYQELIIKLTNA